MRDRAGMGTADWAGEQSGLFYFEYDRFNFDITSVPCVVQDEGSDGQPCLLFSLFLLFCQLNSICLTS